MTANSADAQKLWGYIGGDGGDGGDVAAALLVKQAPNAAGPVVYGDFLFSPAGGIDATANGTTLTYTFSFIAGSATGGGAIDATANGVTFTYSNALISGAATASSQATGQLLTTSRSLIAGQAQASSQASGVILSTGRSLIAGNASASSTASGTVLQFSYSVIAGSASGESDATANGVTLSYSMSLIDGVASGNEIAPSSPNRGDDVGRGVKPIIYRKQKALEQVLELVEDLEPQTRTSVKRAAVKQAREQFRAVELTADYEPASKAIAEALSKLSRAAGEYEAFQAAAMRAAMQIEALIAEMDRKRQKRRAEEEMLISWLLS